MKVQITVAAGLLSGVGARGQGTIFSGVGFGTYYYDVKHVDACGTSFAEQNKGPLECDSQTALSLDQVNSNYVVAMNHSQLVSDMATYCGKRVVVSVNGTPSDMPLFIGDGCARCAGGSASSETWNPVGAPGLDFSYSVLNELSRGVECTDGYIPISWEIMDDTIYKFGTNGAGIPQGSRSAPVAVGNCPVHTYPIVPTGVVTSTYDEQQPSFSLFDRAMAL